MQKVCPGFPAPAAVPAEVQLLDPTAPSDAEATSRRQVTVELPADRDLHTHTHIHSKQTFQRNDTKSSFCIQLLQIYGWQFETHQEAYLRLQAADEKSVGQ